MGRLLVDGYNVIRTDPALSAVERRDPPAARAELARLLAHHSLAPYDVLLVFDGVPPQGEPPKRGRVRLLYGRERSADAVIAEIGGAGDVVVTNDRALAAATLDGGPLVWSVERLLGMVRRGVRRVKRRQPRREERPTPRVRGLRRFDVCPRCLFYTRDDWLMLCEEDGALGGPRNFREGW